VVNALIKANKTFELVVVPGANHGAGGPFSIRKRNDWFVKNLLGLDPPNWNQMDESQSTTATAAAVAALEPDYEAMERAAFFDEEP
jgi:hypothetical protein